VSEIDDGLLAGETVVTRTTKHWFSIISDSTWAILLILAALLAIWFQGDKTTGITGFINRILGAFGEVLLLGAIGWIVFNVLAWRTAEYAVTTLRVRGHEGLIRKRSTDTLLSSVTDIQSKQSAIGGMLNFGNIRVITASGDTGEDNFTSIISSEAFKKAVLEQKTQATASPAPAAQPSQTAASPAETATSAPAGSAPPVDPMAQIHQLSTLRDEGAITTEEYETKKAELLSRV
jgi:uncharacterized membrane protein YdbT with pleckstrin-like domain